MKHYETQSPIVVGFQYIEKRNNLRKRLKQWEKNQYHGEQYTPFGSFAWIAVLESEISELEAILSHQYEPKYNIQYPPRPYYQPSIIKMKTAAVTSSH